MESTKRQVHLVNDTTIETTSDYFGVDEHGVYVTEVLEGDKRRRTLYPWHRIADVVHGD